MRRIPGVARRATTLLPLLFLLATAVVAASHTPDLAEDPMLAEIRGLVDQSRSEVASLQARFRAATTEDEALAIQRQINEHELRTELGVLQIEHRYAVSRGQEHAAQRIERSIRKMEDAR